VRLLSRPEPRSSKHGPFPHPDGPSPIRTARNPPGQSCRAVSLPGRSGGPAPWLSVTPAAGRIDRATGHSGLSADRRMCTTGYSLGLPSSTGSHQLPHIPRSTAELPATCSTSVGCQGGESKVGSRQSRNPLEEVAQTASQRHGTLGSSSGWPAGASGCLQKSFLGSRMALLTALRGVLWVCRCFEDLLPAIGPGTWPYGPVLARPPPRSANNSSAVAVGGGVSLSQELSLPTLWKDGTLEPCFHLLS
jgi:hypothetical protein